MNVLSLFDGMSCGQIALNRIGINPAKYYAAEIDKYAIQVTQANYPKTIQLGSVTEWRDWNVNWSSLDLISGGFPCQAWSMAGKQLGDKDERGMLFWVMLDIMKHAKSHNPKIKFLIENVKMKKEFEEYITHHTEQALGEVNKVLINSALVSAQNRNRYYWTNWHVEQPEDKGIVLADIIEQEVAQEHFHSDKAINYMQQGNKKWQQAGARRADRYEQSVDKEKAFCITANIHKGVPYNYFRHDTPQRVVTDTDIKCGAIRGRYLVNGKRADTQVDSMVGITQQRLEVRKDEKTNTLTTVQKDNVIVEKDKQYRKLTPIECERLQTVPDNYTNHVSNTQRYKMLGNGWTVDVIAHILNQADL